METAYAFLPDLLRDELHGKRKPRKEEHCVFAKVRARGSAICLMVALSADEFTPRFTSPFLLISDASYCPYIRNTVSREPLPATRRAITIVRHKVQQSEVALKIWTSRDVVMHLATDDWNPIPEDHEFNSLDSPLNRIRLRLKVVTNELSILRHSTFPWSFGVHWMPSIS
jgi:hypothetical protein